MYKKQPATSVSCIAPRALVDRLDRFAAIMGVSRSDAIRYGLTMFLDSVIQMKTPPNPIPRKPAKLEVKTTREKRLFCTWCGSNFPVGCMDDIGRPDGECPICGLVQEIPESTDATEQIELETHPYGARGR